MSSTVGPTSSKGTSDASPEGQASVTTRVTSCRVRLGLLVSRQSPAAVLQSAASPSDHDQSVGAVRWMAMSRHGIVNGLRSTAVVYGVSVGVGVSAIASDGPGEIAALRSETSSEDGSRLMATRPMTTKAASARTRLAPRSWSLAWNARSEWSPVSSDGIGFVHFERSVTGDGHEGRRRVCAQGYSNWIESTICWISCPGSGPAPL